MDNTNQHQVSFKPDIISRNWLDGLVRMAQQQMTYTQVAQEENILKMFIINFLLRYYINVTKIDFLLFNQTTSYLW